MSVAMETIFDLITEDFKRELSTIRRLLHSTQTVDLKSTDLADAAEAAPEGRMDSGSALPTISHLKDTDSNVKIAASNAATLLLAASFEEYIRQILKEYVDVISNRANSINDIPPKMLSSSWERAIYLLNSSTFGTPKFDHSRAEEIIATLSDLHLGNNCKRNVSSLIAYNSNNMSSKELTKVIGRVGIEDICGVIGSHREYIQFFGVANGGQARTQFSNYLDDFYNERNEVAHSIGSRKGSGFSNMERHIQFFEIFSSVLVIKINQQSSVS